MLSPPATPKPKPNGPGGAGGGNHIPTTFNKQLALISFLITSYTVITLVLNNCLIINYCNSSVNCSNPFPTLCLILKTFLLINLPQSLLLCPKTLSSLKTLSSPKAPLSPQPNPNKVRVINTNTYLFVSQMHRLPISSCFQAWPVLIHASSLEIPVLLPQTQSLPLTALSVCQDSLIFL